MSVIMTLPPLNVLLALLQRVHLAGIRFSGLVAEGAELALHPRSERPMSEMRLVFYGSAWTAIELDVQFLHC